ncbi:MAG: TonB family protein [Chthoniobacterales bacterium]|nr:TonB family protein [Chthoniobacterales bacterium]
MSQNWSFWRNVTMIGAAHAIVLLGLTRWGGTARKPLATDIVWMDGGQGTTSALASVATPVIPEVPEPNPAPATEEPLPTEPPTVPPVRSDIEEPTPMPLPTATATPFPTPAPNAALKATPKPTAKSTPKATPRQTLAAKASPVAKSSATPAGKKPAEAKKVVAVNAAPSSNGASSKGSGSPSAVGGDSSGPGGASQFGWYSSMLHDRFFSEWVQPTSVVASGAKMSVLVRLRIERDGRVSQFSIVRPSGNVVIDESVTSVAGRVLKVDPLPAGLGNGGPYDVNINFELNPE